MAAASRVSFFDFTSYHTFQAKYLESQTAYYKKKHDTLPKWLIAFFQHKTRNFLIPNMNVTNGIAPEHHKAYTILLKSHEITQELTLKIQQSPKCVKCYSVTPITDHHPFLFNFSSLIEVLVIPQVQEAFPNANIQSDIEIFANAILGTTTTIIRISCVDKKSIIEQNK